MTSASSAPARAITNHRAGAALLPNSAKGAVNSTGSGFHDGPPTVERSRWTTSRPQMIHDHGS